MKMDLRSALTTAVAVLAIALLGLLVWMTQGLNNVQHLDRLQHIRNIDAYDVQLNRSLTQAHSTVNAADKDTRAAITQKIGVELDAIDKGPDALRGLTPEIDKALDQFLDTIDTKFELAFDYENRNILANQRLIAGVDAVVAFAEKIPPLAKPAFQGRARELASQIKTELFTFTVLQTPENVGILKERLDQLEQLDPQASPAFKDAMTALRGRTLEVINDKNDLTNKLTTFLSRPTGVQLRAVEQAYLKWHGAQTAVINRNRLLLGVYAGLLLLALAALGLRLRRSFKELDRANETLEQQVQDRTRDLSNTLKELKASQAQLIQSEKMASLGQMVAGVAHEINTPLGYVRSNASIVRNMLKELHGVTAAQDRAIKLMVAEDADEQQIAAALEHADALSSTLNPDETVNDLDALLGDADHGLETIAELVAGLKDFSRVDRSKHDLFDVNDGIESSLKIGHNVLKHKVEVVKEYGEIPQIECSPSQLNQVFLNLITNGAQAIENEGQITIRTRANGNGVEIKIGDTGCGMTPEVRQRIFEPFYTTKPVGKGTGLGLSIVYRIIEDHGGTIQVESTPGAGSEFTIHLPLRQSRGAEI